MPYEILKISVSVQVDVEDVCEVSIGDLEDMEAEINYGDVWQAIRQAIQTVRPNIDPQVEISTSGNITIIDSTEES